MANFRQIHVKIWKDPWFLELEPDEKLLFTYLVTNESTNLAGIYEISMRVMEFETGMTRERLSEILAKFSENDKVYCEGDIVWVVNLRRYHETGSERVKKRILADVARIPPSEILERYIAYYPSPIGYAYPIGDG